MDFWFLNLGKLYRRSFLIRTSNEYEYLRLVARLLKTSELKTLANNMQHSDITALEHVISVSFISYVLAKRFGWDYKAAARAGLLHDLVYYDWHEKDNSHRLHGYRHPGFALKNAKELTELNHLEENIILRHMWPLTITPPRYKEAMLVSFVDKYCAAKETLRKYQSEPEVLRHE